MLDEKRVKLMVKLASYESKEGKRDLKVSSYFRRDYTSFNVLCTLLWTTIGYVLIVGLAGIAFLEQLLDNFTMKNLIMLGVGIIIGYVFVIIVYCVISRKFYKKKHYEARQRVKKFNHNLLILNRLYEKEKA